MRINTTLIHTDKGRPQIVAKAMGSQKTTNYDHGSSHDRNHGEAAGNLILHMFKSGKLQGSDVAALRIAIEDGTATHDADGAKHTFAL